MQNKKKFYNIFLSYEYKGNPKIDLNFAFLILIFQATSGTQAQIGLGQNYVIKTLLVL